jgi:hypothetical protein
MWYWKEVIFFASIELKTKKRVDSYDFEYKKRYKNGMKILKIAQESSTKNFGYVTLTSNGK